MSELTKEYFETHLRTELSHFENLLKQQTDELKEYADEKQSELATLVQEGFEGERKLFEDKLDVREKVMKLEIDMKQIKEALHLTQ